MGCTNSKNDTKYSNPPVNFSSSPSNSIRQQDLTQNKIIVTTSIPPTSASADTQLRQDALILPSPTNNPPETKSVLTAVTKIQKQARRRKALKVAHAEQQWKMFADLDTQDEAEMLHLAVFMQTLVDLVPNTERTDSQRLKYGLESETEEEEEAMIVSLDQIQLKDRVSNNTNSFKTDVEYEITASKINTNVAIDIVETYRRGGRLSRRAIVKILRKVYKNIQKQSNVTRLTVQNTCKLTVVGDVHGQLPDLLHILDESGYPSVDNKYVFNGDFVDRGENGLEIIIILFAFYLAEGPEVVAMNRGNHEDLAVCRVYGFEAEVKTKYDDLLFAMIAEVFNYLPLFTLVNESIFIVHGGLFHKPDVKLSELDDIDRSDYYVKPLVGYPQNTIGKSPEEAYREYLCQLQRDALWSDPTEDVGCYANPRGAGVSFGPNIAADFMRFNHIDMVIRSHECVVRGYDLPYAAAAFGGDYEEEKFAALKEFKFLPNPEGLPLLCTIFSASNYGDGDNDGAFLEFLTHPFTNSFPTGKHNKLHYAVKRFKMSTGKSDKLELSNKQSLTGLILKKKPALLTAFEAKDTDNLGVVSRNEWADIMQSVTKVRIRWLAIISTIAPEECLSSNSVAYRIFLSNFSLKNPPGGANGENGTTGNLLASTAMDDMYGQRRKLETVFYYFDTNGDGVISLDEFRAGCALLNARLHPDCQLTNIEHTLAMMDFDQSGTVDINEFFETFRILDAKDGKVDGIISLAANSQASRRFKDED